MARRPQLHPHHKQAAIVSRMELLCFKALLNAYNGVRRGGDAHTDSFAGLFNDFYITMVILANDERGRRPISINAISKQTGLSRDTVRKRAANLEQFGVLMRVGKGLAGNPLHFNDRVSERVYEQLRGAIIAAATELKKLARLR